MNQLINAMVYAINVIANQFLMPIMLIAFIVGVIARLLVFYTVKRQEWFVKEFEKRVMKFIEGEADSNRRPHSFYSLSKKLLEKTYYELFEMRGAMKRRRMDYITTPSDRLFLIQTGSAWFVRDCLRNFRFLRKSDDDPKFIDVAKNVFKNNAPWNRVFGIIPVGPLNDILNLLVGLFIIGGIFGTFVGIMQALPTLGNMDLANMEETKNTMNGFLTNISFSMATSIVGMIYSVSLSIVNALANPEKTFFQVVANLEATLTFLWGRCETNEIPPNIPKFDEHKDPIEALAELAVDKELKNYNPKEGQQRQSLPPPPTKKGESEEAKKEAS
jgi:hypothetical protein